MRTLLAVLVLVLACGSSLAVAVVPCPKCLPGTTPAAYRVIAGGAVIDNCPQGDAFRWQGRGGYIVWHCGGFAPAPGGGIFSVPAVVVWNPDLEVGGSIIVPEIRDGNGPWMIALKDRNGKPTGTVVTVMP